MKKLTLLLVSFILGTIAANAQTAVTAESLLKAKQKSDADIGNAKKSGKSATWEKRGNLFLDMAQFSTKLLYVGMPASGIQGAEVLAGKPNKKLPTKVGEDWIYPRIKLHFKNGKLDSWDETKPIDKDALNKAYEAYKKADELDTKGKFNKKVIVKSNIAVLRGLLTNKGIKLYEEKNYSPAVTYLEKALELDKFPKEKNDTSFRTDLITYYVGIISNEAGDSKKAKEYFQLCMNKGYQKAAPYKSLAELYKKEGDSKKELELLQKGFTKYPDSKEIMVGFINYYLTSGQSDKALEKLNDAIKSDPKNPSFHYAVGTLYDNMSTDTTNRYNEQEKEKYLNLAVEAYKKAKSLKADYFEPNYNIGALYYNKAAHILKEASKLDISKAKEYEAAVKASERQFELALPCMEEAHRINPKEKSTMQTLVTIYHKLRKYDKKKAMQAELDQL